MHKTKLVTSTAALFACSGLVAADLRAAELEGALQYPPRSIGEDAQPPPPARMLPQPVSPWRVELGVSGSSMPPSTQRFLYPFPAPPGGTRSPRLRDYRSRRVQERKRSLAAEAYRGRSRRRFRSADLIRRDCQRSPRGSAALRTMHLG